MITLKQNRQRLAEAGHLKWQRCCWLNACLSSADSLRNEILTQTLLSLLPAPRARVAIYSADVRISNTGSTSDDASDDEYQIPADTPNQQQDDALAHATIRRDLPAWEYKISISNAPFGTPRVVKMHSGGWRMEMAPRIRKDAARQIHDEPATEAPVEQPTGTQFEQPNEVHSEHPDAAAGDSVADMPIDAPTEQPNAAGGMPSEEPSEQLPHGTSRARRMLLV
jgi:hypothetical protein